MIPPGSPINFLEERSLSWSDFDDDISERSYSPAKSIGDTESELREMYDFAKETSVTASVVFNAYTPNEQPLSITPLQTNMNYDTIVESFIKGEANRILEQEKAAKLLIESRAKQAKETLEKLTVGEKLPKEPIAKTCFIAKKVFYRAICPMVAASTKYVQGLFRRNILKSS